MYVPVGSVGSTVDRISANVGSKVPPVSAVGSILSKINAASSAGDKPSNSSAQNSAEESSPAFGCSSTVSEITTSSSHPSSVVNVAVVVNV